MLEVSLTILSSSIRVRHHDERQLQISILHLPRSRQCVEDRGKIITIVTGLLGAYTLMYSLYQGSKAPMEWFTKALSKELLPRGVAVNAIAPGLMDTPSFYAQETKDSIAILKSGAIDGRLTHIQDIAPLVRFLITEGHWITGQTLFASGGFTTR